jgi:hypothetical protein
MIRQKQVGWKVELWMSKNNHKNERYEKKNFIKSFLLFFFFGFISILQSADKLAE